MRKRKRDKCKGCELAQLNRTLTKCIVRSELTINDLSEHIHELELQRDGRLEAVDEKEPLAAEYKEELQEV